MATTLSLTTRRSSAMANLAASKAPSGAAEGVRAKTQSSGYNNDAAGRKAASSINGKSYDEEAQQQTPDTGAESDVDELVDSDTEKTVESKKNTRTGTRGRLARGSSTAAAAKPGSAGGKKASTTTASAETTETKDVVMTNGNAALSSTEAAKTSAHSPQEDRTAKPAQPQAALKVTSPISTRDQHNAPKTSGGPGSSREMLGRTATGGPLPYYYAQPHAAPSRTTASGSKKMASGGAPIQASSKNGFIKGEAGSESEDLTPQEVDKFMDLIEKYNLDGSNEDEMARSVTELYQEWLEWCAKRNVQSTKSKQALVSEFVRIHHGTYGVARQQRAIGIVQGSRSFDHAGMTNAARQTSSNGHGSRSSVAHRSDSSQKLTGTRASEVASSAARVTRSPAVVSRSITPAPATYDGSYVKEIPAVVLEDMHRQIRDEIWKEVAIVINQMVHEQVSDIVADNHAMAARIEQLETHSDNLAQWVQHLNRVQEASASSAQLDPVVPAATEMRGGGAQQPAEYHHRAPSYHHSSQAHPNYAPRGYPPAYSSGTSPNHGYAMPVRTSPSPPLSTHGLSTRAQHPQPSKEVYDRQAGAAFGYGSAPPPPPAAHPHHAYHAPHHESPHMMSGRAAAPPAGPGGGGGAAYYEDAVRAPPSEYGPADPRGTSMRAYYSQARDDRMLPPQPGSPGAGGEMRQVKRARNGL